MFEEKNICEYFRVRNNKIGLILNS